MPIRYQQICILAVYPCAYREHHVPFHSPTNVGGLSLCIQGTLSCAENIFKEKRFIPVHTGNIAVSPDSHFIPAVYPCAYREHLLIMHMIF